MWIGEVDERALTFPPAANPGLAVGRFDEETVAGGFGVVGAGLFQLAFEASFARRVRLVVDPTGVTKRTSL